MDHLTDQQFLGLLCRLYALKAPLWETALDLVCALLQADGGVVGVQDDQLRVRAGRGAWQSIAFPEIEGPGFRVAGDLIVLRSLHRELPIDSVWMLYGVASNAVINLRASSVVANLELAIDFAFRRDRGAMLSDRLREPDPERVDEIRELLAELPRRSGACILLAARGMTNLQIAEYLDLTSATVARCLQEGYRHFGVAGRNELDVAALLSQPKPPPAHSRSVA
ncbi:MAG: sigma factor-like helix-turn-helix DNA-binding protein [bacterium]